MCEMSISVLFVMVALYPVPAVKLTGPVGFVATGGRQVMCRGPSSHINGHLVIGFLDCGRCEMDTVGHQGSDLDSARPQTGQGMRCMDAPPVYR